MIDQATARVVMIEQSDDHTVFAIPGTNYRLHLTTPKPLDDSPGDRVRGAIRCNVWKVDTVSPGGGDSAYLSFQGTSMAAPHVSGAAAVLLGTGLAPDAVIDALYRSAVDIDSDGFDERTGHGLLDLGAALGDTRRDGGALLAGSAGALALFIGVFAGLRRESLVPLVALSAFVGGGLFVAEPLGALAQGAWAWPTALFGPSAAGFPGWASALVPLLLALTLGPHPKGWVVAAAIAVGFAVGLWWGAASGFIDTWWVANPVEWLWLAMNALICVVVAMAVVGLRKARQRR